MSSGGGAVSGNKAVDPPHPPHPPPPDAAMVGPSLDYRTLHGIGTRASTRNKNICYKDSVWPRIASTPCNTTTATNGGTRKTGAKRGRGGRGQRRGNRRLGNIGRRQNLNPSQFNTQSPAMPIVATNHHQHHVGAVAGMTVPHQWINNEDWCRVPAQPISPSIMTPMSLPLTEANITEHQRRISAKPMSDKYENMTYILNWAKDLVFPDEELAGASNTIAGSTTCHGSSGVGVIGGLKNDHYSNIVTAQQKYQTVVQQQHQFHHNHQHHQHHGGGNTTNNNEFPMYHTTATADRNGHHNVTYNR